MSACKPYPKTKPSGVVWLWDVPDGWEVKLLKFMANLLTQKCEGRRKAIGLENIESWSGRFIETETEFDGEGVAVEGGDILFGKLRPYLAKALLVTEPSDAVDDRDYDDILLCDKLYRLRFHRGVSEIYISHYLGTSEVRQPIELDATGASASMVNIGQDCIRELNLALPPLAEQRAIVAHLDDKCGKIDRLRAKAERAIGLLKERRSALISAAVTGKIEGRGDLAGQKDTISLIRDDQYLASCCI